MISLFIFFSSAELSNLAPDTFYKIFVYAENGVSEASNTESFTFKEVTTLASIPKITHFKPTEVGETSITLSWLVEDPTVTVLQYKVKHYIKGKIGTEVVNITKATSITYKHLKKQTEYAFQVREDNLLYSVT